LPRLPARFRTPPGEIQDPGSISSNTSTKKVSGGHFMKIRPLYDRIVVKRLEEQEQVQGGIIIPDTAKEKPQEGEVVAVGKGKRNDKGEIIALELEVGNKILFGKYSGSDIKVDGNEYLIMREDEVLAVIA